MSECLSISEILSNITNSQDLGLSYWESVIERCEWAKAYALREIRDNRHYLETHFTWEAYLKEKHDLSISYANRLIAAIPTVEIFAPMGAKISTERQIREVVSLPPAQQREVWQTAVETAPEGKITAAHIRSVVDQMTQGEQETIKAISKEITARRAEANAIEREEIKARPVVIPRGKYSCIVIDPPWPMEKIGRDERPNQVGFAYPTMTEEELQAWPLPALAADDCHLYIWTTHKFMPMALRLAGHWGFNYQCLMTWVKNVGMTPFSWMYSTEHVLFCRRGSLPLEKLGMRLDFQAKVREHSRKPDEFYELVRQASPGPRIDVFSREARDGFDQHGNEAEKFQEVGA